MTRHTIMLVTTSLLALTLAIGNMATAEEQGFEPIFDGKTLQGWDGKKGMWSVQDGAITGQTTPDNPLGSNTFLIWQGGKLDDFELRIKFKLVGGNSGVQYRSREVSEFVGVGYQADFNDDDESKEWICVLYDEKGRGKIANRGSEVVIDEKGANKVIGITTSEKKLLENFNTHGWNEYQIIAKGNHLVQILNRLTTVDLLDKEKDKAHTEGIIPLQLHTGPPMTVQFKDIRIKRF